MEDSNKRIIEINGVKMEIDLRQAKVIDKFKVGDYVKILIRSYGDNFASYVGNIIGFDNFETTPTIVIAYLKTEYSEASIQFAYFNSKSKDIEITMLNAWDIPLTKSMIVEKFEKEKLKKLQEIKEIENKAKIFEELFGKYFEGKFVSDESNAF